MTVHPDLQAGRCVCTSVYVNVNNSHIYVVLDVSRAIASIFVVVRMHAWLVANLVEGQVETACTRTCHYCAHRTLPTCNATRTDTPMMQLAVHTCRTQLSDTNKPPLFLSSHRSINSSYIQYTPHAHAYVQRHTQKHTTFTRKNSLAPIQHHRTHLNK